MLPKSLKVKVSVYLTFALSAAMILFILLIVQYHRNDLLNEVSRHANQISELIIRSTRYAMLVDQPDFVDKIIQDIGAQKGIEKVRVFSKDGRIIHSNHPDEVGKVVDRQAEACVVCHEGTKPPPQHVPNEKKWRTFKTADGRTLLGSMAVIRNEASCSNAECHHHSGQVGLSWRRMSILLWRHGYCCLILKIA